MKLEKGMIVMYNKEKCEVTRVAFDIMCNLLPLKYKHFGYVATLPYIHYGVDVNSVDVYL